MRPYVISLINKNTVNLIKKTTIIKIIKNQVKKLDPSLSL
jgi:hypothetical protein